MAENCRITATDLARKVADLQNSENYWKSRMDKLAEELEGAKRSLATVSGMKVQAQDALSKVKV